MYFDLTALWLTDIMFRRYDIMMQLAAFIFFRRPAACVQYSQDNDADSNPED